MRGGSVDVSRRAFDIVETINCEPQSSSKDIEKKEQVLDELADAVMDINEANNFCSGTNAKPIIELILYAPPSLQWRAAEVVANCVQNNPAAQEYFMQAGIMDPLMLLLENDDLMCQIKALLALSCMVREYRPACEWFSHRCGIQKVEAILKSTNEFRLQRKCLALVDTVLCASSCLKVDTNNIDTSIYVGLVANSTSSELRIAALSILTKLVQHQKSSLSYDDLTLLSTIKGEGKVAENETMLEEEQLMVKDLQTLLNAEMLFRRDENQSKEILLIKAPDM
jgi:hypothetical protein